MSRLYYVEQISHGCGDEVTLNIRWNNTRMTVNLDRNSSPNATENLLIEKYTSACLSGDEDEEDAVQDEVLDAIVGVGQSKFDQIAPPPTAPISDLHSILFPPQYSFNLVTVGGRMELLLEGSYRLEKSVVPGKGYEAAIPIPYPLSPKPQFPTFSFRLEIKEDPKLRRHLTTNIQVAEKLLGDGYITHVSVDGRDMCAKVGRDFDGGAIQRELDCLEKITTHAAQHTPPINVPKLLGLIETPNDGEIIGILEEFIPHSESQELSTLAMIDDVSAISKERRGAWALQVRQTVDWLHSIGIIWGDGKADNVLIHPDTDEAWLIDFGGGSTVGWVDENLAGTADGDDQAVGRIFEFLQISQGS